MKPELDNREKCSDSNFSLKHIMQTLITNEELPITKAKAK